MSEGGDDNDLPKLSSDAPTLRSVPMSGLGAGSGLVDVKFPSFAKLAPLTTTLAPSATPFGLKKEWCASWKVKTSDLEPVPVGFPLEKTHREIYEDASLVTSRITNALRDMSIESKFCNESAKATCTTDDHVHFKIRLFAGGEGGQPIVVEVQKRSGPSFMFVRSCRAILNAADGSSNTKRQSTGPTRFPKPLSQMKCLQSVMKQNEPVGQRDHLSCVKRLFESEQKDQVHLALEKLCCLTDPIQSSPSVAFETAKALLKDETMRVHLILKSPENSLKPEQDNQLLHLSLKAIGNTCGLCSAHSGWLETIEDDSWFSDALLPHLLHVLSQHHSLSSYEASRCLLPLLESGDVRTKIIHQTSGKADLIRAYKHGGRFHQLLEQESLRCLNKLSQS